MKKFLLLTVGVVGLIGVLAGCSDKGGGEEVGNIRNGHFLVTDKNDSYYTERDISTGCTYMEARDDWSITPLYGKDGKVTGCGDTNINAYGVKH